MIDKVSIDSLIKLSSVDLDATLDVDLRDLKEIARLASNVCADAKIKFSMGSTAYKDWFDSQEEGLYKQWKELNSSTKGRANSTKEWANTLEEDKYYNWLKDKDKSAFSNPGAYDGYYVYIEEAQDVEALRIQIKQFISAYKAAKELVKAREVANGTIAKAKVLGIKI